jgi:hypothetical protein
MQDPSDLPRRRPAHALPLLLPRVEVKATRTTTPWCSPRLPPPPHFRHISQSATCFDAYPFSAFTLTKRTRPATTLSGKADQWPEQAFGLPWRWSQQDIMEAFSTVHYPSVLPNGRLGIFYKRQLLHRSPSQSPGLSPGNPSLVVPGCGAAGFLNIQCRQRL